MFFFFFFKQKTAYELRISDWSSDVFSADLLQYRDRRGDGIDERSDARRRRDAAGPCVAAGSLGERGADAAADRAAYCAHALADPAWQRRRARAALAAG